MDRAMVNAGAMEKPSEFDKAGDCGAPPQTEWNLWRWALLPAPIDHSAQHPLDPWQLSVGSRTLIPERQLNEAQAVKRCILAPEAMALARPGAPGTFDIGCTTSKRQ
ncbi:hypothetical protein NDU88_001320 [Pleurodeles waltl]|uniref:Uncharacterized protein n=1 Tax=Pleurodeles waltl TaxID=8319 RepID=A0AAV7L953_PLEWA|nr:hypothetical protein NDU88_001320 [Pleurodeles waltl]